MAEQLESLAHHYDNMSNALHDFESGEEFSEEDIEGWRHLFSRHSYL